MAFAERFFWLDVTVDGSKQTRRQSFLKVAEIKKIDPQVLFKLPEYEPSVFYLFQWFLEIKKTYEPITYSEISAWNDLTKNYIKPDELKIIMKLDSIWIKENTKSKTEK